MMTSTVTTEIRMDDTMRCSPFFTDNSMTQGAHTVFLPLFYLCSVIHIIATTSRLFAAAGVRKVRSGTRKGL
jgi:hypothetical protein